MSSTTRTIDPIKKLYFFKVSGTRPFPFDMLRYDCCWPETEWRDSVAFQTMDTARKEKDEFTLHLISIKEPTVGRWESFGWKVVE